MNIRQSYLFFAVATLVAVATRSLMLFFCIDAKSGFIKTEYLAFSIIMLVIIAASVILTFVFSALSRVVNYTPERKDGLVFKTVSFILAAVILYDTFFSAPTSVSVVQRNLNIIISLAAAAALISHLAFDLLKLDYPKIFTAVPIIYWFMRLIIVFTQFSSLSTVIDNTLELICLCSILVCSLQLSKVFCAQLGEKQIAFNLPLFLSSASLCLVNGLPRMIMIATGNASLMHENGISPTVSFIAGLYFLIFAIECYPFGKVNFKRILNFKK